MYVRSDKIMCYRFCYKCVSPTGHCVHLCPMVSATYFAFLLEHWIQFEHWSVSCVRCPELMYYRVLYRVMYYMVALS